MPLSKGNSLDLGSINMAVVVWSMQYLDENKKLILAIMDNQNLGKLAECAQYQAQLQKNLMYLAAIADAQPQAPTMPSQMPPHPAMQQGGHYMQHPQAAMVQQQGVFAPKVPLQFNPQQIQDQLQQLHHQQGIQGHMGVRSEVGSGDGQGNSAGGHGGGGGGDGEQSYLKGSQNAN
ncbi:hypothetical protein HHK36_001370 [Tetracentron sinense]|uniref:SS18 N-terminal domain-containing protein n=1 Tax=Tetracentron sinense TaxID=13715 RepID=A0A835DUQ2_TETSI|nr:hypothetical protein HHK36_001370 [Tetracentron sinense]